MKKLIKVLSLVLVLIMVLVPVVSLADSSFSAVQDVDTLELKSPIQKVGNGVYSVLRTIAIIVAVCMVAYMAIQWFLATPAKKAELKGRMWSMAIGVILLIGGVWILNTLEAAVKNFTDKG